VADDNIGSSLSHGDCVVLAKDVGSGKHVPVVGHPDDLNLLGVGHARLFEIPAEIAVNQAYGREVLDAGKARVGQVFQEHVEIGEGVGAVHPRQNGGVWCHGDHLRGHVHDDFIGVAVCQKPGKRTTPRHPVAAGIVDDDQVDAARFLAFRGQPCARAAPDDRFARVAHSAKSIKKLFAFKSRHGMSPVFRQA